jgi:alginate O-acetyltransferase complex protein AlgI
MPITSITFVGFAALVVIAFHLTPSRIYRIPILTIANLLFIATYVSEVRQLAPLFVFLSLSYIIIEMSRRYRSGVVILIGISTVLVTYIYLKRFSFLGDRYTLSFPYLLVGLSYILFRVLHLIIDVRNGDITESIKPLAFFNYTCNFLSFVSGPIQLYQDHSRDFGDKPEMMSSDFVSRAFSRIITGYVKVIIISGIADYAFLTISGRILAPDAAPAGAHLVTEYGVCTIIYTVYLYFNFSGYMDIVIGFGRLLGQDLPENFNKPFLSRNFLEFWTRWHMTLSQWFKTYLFTPVTTLLMERVPRPAMAPYLGVVAFFITFFVMGIWHGTTMVFAIYGLLMGAGASINKLWQVMMVARLGRQGYRKLSDQPIYIYACRGLTCSFFAVGITCLWVNLDQLGRLWGSLGVVGLTEVVLLTAMVCAIAMFAQDSVLLRARKWFAWVLALSQRAVLSNFWSAAQIMLILITSTFFHKTPEFVYRAF